MISDFSLFFPVITMQKINTFLDRFLNKGMSKEELEKIEALEYFKNCKDHLEEKVSIMVIFTLLVAVNEDKWNDFYSGELWEIEYNEKMTPIAYLTKKDPDFMAEHELFGLWKDYLVEEFLEEELFDGILKDLLTAKKIYHSTTEKEEGWSDSPFEMDYEPKYCGLVTPKEFVKLVEEYELDQTGSTGGMMTLEFGCTPAHSFKNYDTNAEAYACPLYKCVKNGDIGYKLSCGDYELLEKWLLDYVEKHT